MNMYSVPSGKEYVNWDDVFKESQQMAFTSFNTGNISGALKNYIEEESLPENYDAAKIADYAVLAFHFKHPQKGDILIDSGFDRSFYDIPLIGNLPIIIRIFQKLNKIEYTQKKDEDLLFHLEKYNINPSHAFLTHMHPDHTAGIPAILPDCSIYYGKKENSFYYRGAVGNHLKAKKNIHLLDLSSGASLAPFHRVLDLFGDGTFWALSTPGHTKDHIAYLINCAPAPILIVGDAELNKWGMENEVLMNTDYGKKGQIAVQESAQMIRDFHKMYPQVQIWFSHDTQYISG
ncbi:MAG: MBL fold metallo-hydrolase [bacterium]|nr:MBL fold metallo-hydrolase [bacterium]